jgi:hypothetical protein
MAVWPRIRPACAGWGYGGCTGAAVVIDTPENRGMIRKVSYLLKVEET